MSASIVNYIVIVLFPLGIGACFHYFGAWVGIPAFIVGGMFWIGCLGLQYRAESERKEKVKV